MKDKDDLSPKSIGIIMDGNRRWAKEKGLKSFDGHKEGYRVFKEFLGWVKEFGIKTLYVFAFSSENWNRSEEEVNFLVSLFREMIEKEIDEIIKNNVRVRFAGNIGKFPKDLYEKMLKVENDTRLNDGHNLILCLSYGGRDEILHSVNEIIKSGKKEVTKEDISNNLYSAGFDDPDMIIRTSGEQRLSGFLPWQGVYSELFFTNTLWPDFSKAEFQKILEDFKNRQRRMGV